MSQCCTIHTDCLCFVLQPHHWVEPIAHKHSNSGLLCALVFPHPEDGAKAKKNKQTNTPMLKENAIIQGKKVHESTPSQEHKVGFRSNNS